MDALKKLTELLEQFQLSYEIINSRFDSDKAGETVGLLREGVRVEIADTEDGLIALVVSVRRKILNWGTLREQLGYEKFERADAEEVFFKTGFPLENFPFVGHDLPCILESCLLEKEFICGPAGETGYFLKIASADISQLTHIIALF